MERRTLLTGVVVVGAATLLGCSSEEGKKPVVPEPSATKPAPTESAPSAPARAGTPKVTDTIATGLNVPWGIAFLAGGGRLDLPA
ncbi:hypothetical protein [Aeromicrobium sp. UC242_57]|uniref:hypothetical protein n=1 Tax=Aeromicrobium sp. UC242_57 TaxID=3374624 RepID=UPI003795BF1D